MSGDRPDRLAEELRRWAARPADLPPAMARTRVLARLPRGARRTSWRRLAATAALPAGALALALGFTLWRPAGQPAEPPHVPDRAERMIIHQLSSGTQLYIVIPPSSPEEEC